MSFQSPIEIPGVSNVDFLRMACNARRKQLKQPELDPLEFYAFIIPKVSHDQVLPMVVTKRRCRALRRAPLLNPKGACAWMACTRAFCAAWAPSFETPCPHPLPCPPLARAQLELLNTWTPPHLPPPQHPHPHPHCLSTNLTRCHTHCHTHTSILPHPLPNAARAPQHGPHVPQPQRERGVLRRREEAQRDPSGAHVGRCTYEMHLRDAPTMQHTRS
jgi:hypothetical protein